MKAKSSKILEYLYKHKTENNLSGASLIELPNTDGLNDLYRGGYITIDRDSKGGIKKVSISGKGIDWVKNNSMSDRQKVLKHYYDHRAEGSIFTAELKNILSLGKEPLIAEAKHLVDKGYLEKVGKGAMGGDMFLRITASGVDEVENSHTPKTLEAALASIPPMTVSITSDVISIKIRAEIYSHIKSFLDSGHYFTAVEEAYKIVRQKLKDITGEEAAAAVFGENALNSRHWKIVFGSTPATGTPEADFMRGAGYIHLGVQYLRNEKSHTTATSLDKNLALHYISLASLAYDLISRIDSRTE